MGKEDTAEGRGEDALEGCLVTSDISVGIVIYTVAVDCHENWYYTNYACVEND